MEIVASLVEYMVEDYLLFLSLLLDRLVLPPLTRLLASLASLASNLLSRWAVRYGYRDLAGIEPPQSQEHCHQH
jgi:hypothetical protein